MTYGEPGDGTVVLTMTRLQYGQLLMSLGFALGAMQEQTARDSLVRFINELNRTNPSYTPFQVPAR